MNFNPYLIYQYYTVTKPFLKSLKSPKKVQRELLLKIIKNSKKSEFGKKNNFNKIKSISDFQKNLCFSKFEDIKFYIDKLKKGDNFQLNNSIIKYFALSSGTTSLPKFIPQTENYIKSRKKSWEIWHTINYQLKPKTYSFDTSILTFTSKKKEGITKGGSDFGSISGKLRAIQPFFLKNLYSYPDEILEIDDFELRSYLIILFSIRKNIKLIITPNPSTLIIFAKKFNKYIYNIINDLQNNSIEKLEKDKNLSSNLKKIILRKFKSFRNNSISKKLKELKLEQKTIYPKDIFKNISIIGCWTGGNVGIYSKKLNKYYGNEFLIRDIGFLATEGRFSTPISKKSNAGVLNININFYEFIEVNDYDMGYFHRIKLVHEIEVKKKYYIIVTNENGLFRYFMDDIIEVKNFYYNTPEIIFVQKGKYFSSITGEKISEWEVINVVEDVLSKECINYHTFFTYVNISKETPNYEFYIDFEKKLNEKTIKLLEKKFEDLLLKLNIEYKEKRKTQRLGKIKIKILPNHSDILLKKIFMKENNHDSQVKVPKLMSIKSDIILLKNNNLI